MTLHLSYDPTAKIAEGQGPVDSLLFSGLKAMDFMLIIPKPLQFRMVKEGFRCQYSSLEGRNFVAIISKTLQFRMLKEMAIFIPVLKEDISGSFFHT